ncbi:MAG: glycosyltransferase [Candidatus Erginobacter occultus]|nr:glycosyltransferase [Candidatus Erginobacter occultus]
MKIRTGFISHASVLNGAPITLVELVIELARRSDSGHCVLGIPISGPLLKKYDLSRVELFRYGQGRFGREIPVGRPRIRGRLRRILTDQKISLVVANSLESFRAVEAAADLGLPVIWLIHELAAGYRERREWEEMRSAAGRADRLIFNSRIGASQAGLLGEGMEAKSRVIYPGISLDRPGGEDVFITGNFRAGKSSPVLGAIGDICPQKGYAELVEAFALIARRRPRARLVIAGRLPEQFQSFKRELDGRIRELSLSGRVRFAGEFFDLRGRLEEFDLLLHPSRSESFGRVVAEALALGVPVVAARSGGVEEIISDGETGFLVTPRDPAALAGAVFRMLEDPDRARRTARQGRRAVEERFSLPRYAGEVASEIRALQEMSKNA